MLAVLSIACSIRTVAADVVSQLPGRDYLVVEAEDVDFIDDPFVSDALMVVTAEDPIYSSFGSSVLPEETNASGEAALYHQPGMGDVDATWKLQFAQAGEYTLYLHYSLFEQAFTPDGYGNEDSFYLALDFDQPPAMPAGWSTLGNQGHNNANEDPPYWEGQYHWQMATFQNGAARYVVSDNQVGQVLDFHIATREAGSSLDLFLFHLDPSLMQNQTEEELDAMFLGGGDLAPLEAGDADQDYDFDQLDLVKVQSAAKYLTGQAATWGEGDWNGAPGGSPGNPPVGDRRFDQLDIVAAQRAGKYLSGNYAAIDGRDTPAYPRFAGASVGGRGSAEGVPLYVPEPATLVPAALGLASLLRLGRRRRIGGCPRTPCR
jgi:hypothetical protein